ncbi:ClpP/crotonase-like domain-containing protein [Cladochytrium replicatum]|nr:ClpP/crotonase-like domain-containing protein [Cladochytrium replicatum]
MATYEGNGIRTVEVLPGNVGYLNISEFSPMKLSNPFFQHAIENGGGDSSNGLLSYFTSKRTKYKCMFWRPENRTTKEYTLETVLGPRYNTNVEGDPKRPVYVLTSKKAFSSAEAFSFFMNGLATAIGETTAGGRHPVWFVRCGHDSFKASISVGRTYSARTGRGWERSVWPLTSLSQVLLKTLCILLGCRATLEKLKAIDPAALRPAKGMLLKRAEATANELEEKLAKANVGEEPAENVDPAAATETTTAEVEAGSEILPPGIHLVKQSDGTTRKMEIKERTFLGIKIRTGRYLKD